MPNARALPIHPPRRAAAGFTLLEVMLALGIFVIGFVAVASIFPVATILQKETVEDVTSQQFTRSAKAMLTGRGLKASSMDTEPLMLPGGVPDYNVHPLGDVLTGLNGWTINDRSYPSTTATATARSYYWVPLARRTNITAVAPYSPNVGDWQVFLFCLKREENVIYTERTAGGAAAPKAMPAWASNDANGVPSVYQIGVTVSGTNRFDFVTVTPPNYFSNVDNNSDGRPDEIAAGDQVLDNNGIIYNVASADNTGIVIAGFIYPGLESGAYPTSLWYGRPGYATTGTLSAASPRTKSPTRKVVILSGADVVVP
jgi:Tfp pilus assembly protein PilV